MSLEKGVAISYQIVFCGKVIGRGFVIDPLNFGFGIVERGDVKQGGNCENGRVLEAGNASGDLPSPQANDANDSP